MMADDVDGTMGELNRLDEACSVSVAKLVDENAAMRKRLLRMDDFVWGETVFVALFPLVYGALTFVFSNALWNPTGVHAAALRVPGAPESWGVLFVLLAVAVIIGSVMRRKWLTVAACMTSALVYATFMFVVLMATAAFPRTVAQAAIYLVFSLLFLNRARLAWVT